MNQSLVNTGTVTTATRRHVNVLLDSKANTQQIEIRARCMRKASDVVVGDRVTLQQHRDELVVVDVLKRRNCLLRSYFSRTKLLASNLDCLFVVTAPAPLFNSLFVDKVLAFSHLEGITPVLLMNKADIGDEQFAQLINLYQSLGYSVITTSCKAVDGISQLLTFLAKQIESNSEEKRKELTHIAFCGMSGVGKSSLLNLLIPEISSRTAEVNSKTGQGKQTTSQACSYLYHLQNIGHSLLTDLPGVQNFGVSKLNGSLIASAFPEFRDTTSRCEFNDCRHLLEPNCGIKTDLANGLIAISRYDSYCHILQEIEDARPF